VHLLVKGLLKYLKILLTIWTSLHKDIRGHDAILTSCTVRSHAVSLKFAGKGKKRITPTRMRRVTANKSSFRHSSLTMLHLELKLVISSSDSQTQVLIRCQKENNTLHLYGNTCHVLGDRRMNENNFLWVKVQIVQMTLSVHR